MTRRGLSISFVCLSILSACSSSRISEPDSSVAFGNDDCEDEERCADSGLADSGDDDPQGGQGGSAGGSAGQGSAGLGSGGSHSDGGPPPNAEPVDKIDLLFMVDNSGSMREEQISLRSQFPRLIEQLAEGVDLDGDGEADAPPAQSVHLGVVSSDLGLSGIAGIPDCDNLGDDGVLQNLASPEIVGCSQAVFQPRFLTYQEGADDLQQLAIDFQCIASLGTSGCGFEQQLESALKALWPGDDSRLAFVPDPAGFGSTGQSGTNFPNGEFLRNDPAQGLSAVAIVLVTDEEDCSSSNMAHFRPIDATVPQDSSLRQQGLNTRCFFEDQRAEPNSLFDTERYVRGFRALRDGNEDLVVFAAIVGVPPALVTPERIDLVDFRDADESDAFYDGILTAPEMQQRVDDRGTPQVDDDNLIPSCDRGASAKAYAPRRIVQVAKGFGANGVIQSICQEDFGPAIDMIAQRIGRVLKARSSN